MQHCKESYVEEFLKVLGLSSSTAVSTPGEKADAKTPHEEVLPVRASSAAELDGCDSVAKNLHTEAGLWVGWAGVKHFNQPNYNASRQKPSSNVTHQLRRSPTGLG